MSSLAAPALSWFRQFKNDDPDADWGWKASFALHGVAVLAIAVALLVHPSPPEAQPEKKDVLKTFTVQGPKSDSKKDLPVPQIAPPKAAKSPIVVKVVDLPVAEMAVQEGGAGGDVFIWTPPQPETSYASSARPGDTSGASASPPSRVVIPEIVLPGQQTEPSLLSFDPAAFSQAAAEAEKVGLNGAGSMTLQVSVDVKGMPSNCVTISSSGFARMDAIGCQLVMSYRYRPASDLSGRQVPAFVEEKLEWSPGNLAATSSSSDNRISTGDDGSIVLEQDADGNEVIVAEDKL